jgi:hypothetical protein
MKIGGRKRASVTPTPSEGLHRGAGHAGWVAAIACAGVFLTWLPALFHRHFDPDEFEHAHAAWSLFQGLVPYRDFFEHHTPWYYYLLALVMRWFPVANAFESARHFLLLGRGLSLLVTVVSVGLVVRLGSRWQGRKVGLLAGLLLVLQPMFFDKSIEIRPDVPALALFMGGLCLLLPGMARLASSAPWRRRRFLLAGLSLGAAVMCTQKALFVLPGLLTGLALWSLVGGRTRQADPAGDAGAAPGVGARSMLILLFLVGVCLPVLLTWVTFALHHAGDAFITNNFLLNARWKPIQTHQLPVLLSTSGPVLALGVLGGVVLLVRVFRGKGPDDGGLLLLLSTLGGLFAGAFVIPSAWAQYYLMPLPLICLFAAHAMVVAVELAGRARHLVLVLALIGLAVLPARKLRHSLDLRNDRQLARLRHVIETTRPDDIVMDGWEGTGVFRPHAFHYFFLHRETLAMLPQRELAMFLGALERGAIRPSLIAVDRHLMALGPRFHTFLRTRYTSTDGFFYVPKPFWRHVADGASPAGVRASRQSQ